MADPERTEVQEELFEGITVRLRQDGSPVAVEVPRSTTADSFQRAMSQARDWAAGVTEKEKSD